ncbi:MAG: tRNA (adenosine(37)-N6)-threonylcarbamoyltransferase complex ATPase subunit type 1 TsaE [Pirellulaceae bacterium]
MQRFRWETRDEEGTRRLGRALANSLPPTAAVALIGTLGSGKTRLVQAIAAACDIDPAGVTSPTFVLCQHHRGTRTIYHLDAYRIQNLDEFLELGVEEYFEGPGITLIEWAERVADCLPPDHLEIQIEITSDEGRTFDMLAYGAESAAVLDRLAEQLIPD